MKMKLKLAVSAACALGVGVMLHSSQDRAVNRWKSAPALSEPRAGACSVLMADGRLLIIGGEGATGPNSSAEAVSPDGSHAALASMAVPRAGHACAAVGDTRVFVAGGYTSAGAALSSTEIYDLRTNTWSDAGLMAFARSNATATTLEDGRVLIAGGELSSTALSSAELFDPGSGAFASVVNGMAVARKAHAAVKLNDNRVLIFGGSTGDASIDSMESFDPQSNAFVSTFKMAAARAGLSATLLADGKVLLAGGRSAGADLASLEIFDPETGISTLAASLNAARSGHQAFRLPGNNTVLFIGGESGGVPVSAAEVYVPWTNSVRVTESLRQARSRSTASPMAGSGRLLVAGGRVEGRAIASTEEFSFPTLMTDRSSYLNGQRVNLSGSGWSPGEQVRLQIAPPAGQEPQSADLVADGSGRIDYSYSVNASTAAGKTTYTADGKSSGLSVRIYAANEAADLDQCANGAVGTPIVPCDWVNGNLGQSKSQYLEGTSIAYRMVVTNLTANVDNLITIEWDTKQGGKYALDYITRWDASKPGTIHPSSSPCIDTDPALSVICSGAPASKDIPFSTDPDIAANTAISSRFGGGPTGQFDVWNGTISNVSAPVRVAGSNNPNRTTITFRATDPTKPVVLAWGAHIATRADWGNTNSAISIPGSPYHMRLIDLNGSGGNQDRSLSADAVIFPALITIIKQALPATGSPAFSFTSNPAAIGSITGFSLTDADNSTSNVDANNSKQLSYAFASSGSVAIAETPIPSGWSLTGISCSITDPGLGNPSSPTTDIGTATATINVVEGTIVTCTFTNQRLPRLKLVKTVINDDGGTAIESDFQGKIDGNNVAWNQFVTVTAGSHTASETTLPTYTASSWGGDCAANGSITLALGEEKVCTITNDDKPAYLTLVKTVTNDDGGTKVASDFQGKIDGNNVAWATKIKVSAGAHTASETTVAGYTASGWGGDCAANGSITLALGDDKTCTVTNNDNPTYLTLVKTVVNDDGGTKTAADFQGKIDANNVAWATKIKVTPGAHTASESTVAGYTASSWGGDCAANGSITLALGDDKTCTITNDDQGTYLTLVKTVVNDDGGTATTANFQGKIDGNSVAWATKIKVTPGAHTASETTFAGYTAGSWGGACAANGSVTLALGEDKTCTITNNDNPTYLTIVKTVVNDDGGTKTAADFQGRIDANNVAWATKIKVTPGAHTASESTVAGYTASSWGGDCAANGSITLALGDDKTCTITNNDNATYLTLVKTVVNDDGGTATTANFQGKIDGNSVAWATKIKVTPGTHTASETTLAGYTAGSWGGACAANGSVTLALGEDKTCTITNNDQPTYLTLVKTVVNNNGGTATTANFQGKIDNVNVAWSTKIKVTPGTHTASETTLAGYAASAWGGACAANGSVSLNLGDDKTCTITNDDITARLRVCKDLVPDPDSGRFNLRIGTTTVLANAGDNQCSAFSPVNVGVTYNANETAGTDTATQQLVNLDDYVATVGGACLANGNITPAALATDYTCTITNTRKAKVQIQKLTNGVVNPNLLWNFAAYNLTSIAQVGQVAAVSQQALAAGQTNSSGTLTLKLAPGSYGFCELNLPAGWNTSFTYNGTVGPTPVAGVYNPDQFSQTPQDNGTRCLNVTLAAGSNTTLSANNTYPQGSQRTIGYWRNWSTCTGGNQVRTAQKNGGALNGFYLIDDVLPQTIGALVIPQGGCTTAVNILSKRDLSGTNRANDAAYSLAAQLLAAKANVAAGASICAAASTAITQAQALLASINFNGTGSYLPPNTSLTTQRNLALSLAGILDQYNNGILCP